MAVLDVKLPLFEGLIKGCLKLGSRRRKRHLSLIFLDLYQLLMRNVVLHWITVDKILSEFYLLLLIDPFFQVLCLMLIAKVIVSMAEIHQNKKDHDTSHDESVQRNEELLVLRNRVVKTKSAANKHWNRAQED